MRIPNFPSKLDPKSITVQIDTRETMPWQFQHVQVEFTGLPTGDYRLTPPLADLICIERKSLADLVDCCGTSRKRFEAELVRLRAYRSHVVVVEASYDDLHRGDWRSKLTPNHVIGSIVGWEDRGTVFQFCGDRHRAAEYAERRLVMAARHEYERLRAFAKQIHNEAAQLPF